MKRIALLPKTAIWWVQNLFRQSHRHQWKTTHTNRWQSPTRQECSCGMTRKIETNDINEPGRWVMWWVYSDGTIGEREPIIGDRTTPKPDSAN